MGKKRYITVIFSTILALLLLFSIKDVHASRANASLSASSYNANVGDSVTITVNINAASWNLSINGSGISDSIVGYDPDGNDTSKVSNYNLDTSSAGTYTISLSGDIYDSSEDEANIGTSITITINEAPAPAPDSTPEPSNNTTNTPEETTRPRIEGKTEPDEDDFMMIETPDVPNISSFEIEGYDIDFQKEKFNYTIDVAKEVTSLKINVSGDNLTVVGDGEVDITGKDEIEVTVTGNNVTQKYTIKLNRGEKENTATSTTGSNTTTSRGSENGYMMYIYIAAGVLTVALIALIVFMIMKNKKDKTAGSTGTNTNMDPVTPVQNNTATTVGSEQNLAASTPAPTVETLEEPIVLNAEPPKVEPLVLETPTLTPVVEPIPIPVVNNTPAAPTPVVSEVASQLEKTSSVESTVNAALQTPTPTVSQAPVSAVTDPAQPAPVQPVQAQTPVVEAQPIVQTVQQTQPTTSTLNGVPVPPGVENQTNSSSATQAQ